MNRFADAMNTGNFHVGKACTDCYIAFVNGDTSGNSDDWNEEQFGRTCEEYDITPGHPHFHTDWFDDCPHAGESCPDDADCDCERDEFSRSACDMCGSNLDGERYDVIMIKREYMDAASS